jgi:DNA modification methylase
MDDHKTEEEYAVFVRSLMRNSLAVAKENVHLFFWSDERYIGLIQSMYRELGVDSKRVLLWVKGGDNPTPNVAWNKAFEPCTYGVIGRPFLAKNVTQFNQFMNHDIGNGARIFDDISDLFQLWLVRRLPGVEYDHPTQKPVALYEKALRRCTRPGDNVMDLCAGSGTLLIGCEQMKRRAFVSEVDPIFATLIKNRYETLTGNKAKRIG